MEGYYDHAPQVDLPRAVVATSLLTDFTRAVAYRTAALSGLPFHDVDRLVEHDVGQDIGRLVLLEGEAAYRTAESRCLERVVRQRPLGVIALGDGGLLSPLNRELIAGTCALVVLDLDLANLYWRIQQLCQERDSPRWHPLFEGVPDSPKTLQPYARERRQTYDQADHRIMASGRRPGKVSDQLTEWIGGRARNGE